LTTPIIGTATSRVDGRVKVRGEAKYSAEYQREGLLHGYVVLSDIPSGRIIGVDTSQAEEIAGVVKILTHENAPRLVGDPEEWQDQVAPSGQPFRPLQGDEILYGQQPIALVVGETFEVVRYASRLLRFEYRRAKHQCDFEGARGTDSYEAPEGKSGFTPRQDSGNESARAFDSSPFKISQTYLTPSQHHNPMEPHVTIAEWNKGELTVWSKTQGVSNSRSFLARIFEIKEESVQVKSPYVGGAFGSGLRPQYQVVLAAMAAKELKRPVKVVLTRSQMFSFGHRPKIQQEVKLSADTDGNLTSLSHRAWSETSTFEHFTPSVVNWGGSLYACPNRSLEHRLVPLNVYTPLDMRAPGGATGMHALECAMDELAYELKMDPLDLRLQNYAEVEPSTGRPYSSKELRECYRQAASKFGWSNRKMEPRSHRRGDYLVGLGMAGGIWEVGYQGAKVRVTLSVRDGLRIATGSSDIGPGTYTIVAQIAADTLGYFLPEDVKVELGDTSLPRAPLQGGSMTAASVGTAVRLACGQLKKKLKKLAQQEGVCADLPPREILRRSGTADISHVGTNEGKDDEVEHAMYAHSTSFVEVEVHKRLGNIKVSRMVLAIAAGKIINPTTATSQALGCAVWGVGMGLREESFLDGEVGKFINHNLAEYHVPVNADIPDTKVIFVEEDDPHVNPMGVKGIGEVGLVGVSAAIANAIFHATGKRVRKLPVLLDDVL
jgi:xanthine dehydrogenase YagR molybdenum-binding subunit